MIAEEILSKKKTRSIKNLVQYMLDTENDGDKVGYYSVTNCINDDPEMAVIEMILTQEANRRTKQEKTFHMVISFPPGEKPNREQMDDIEQTLADSIGMGHHQRISVSHTNTENYHLHVAINKIDPITHNIRNKYFYQRDMMRACTELEIKHGLTVNPRRHIKNEKLPTISMDYHSGEQSFQSWACSMLKKPVEEVLQKPSSWSDIHKVMIQHGVTLKKSGRGLAIVSHESAIKASSVSRKLTLKRLEDKLGPFKDPVMKQLTGVQYQRSEHSPFYMSYLNDKEIRQDKKNVELEKLRKQVSAQRLKLKLEYVLARSKVKNSFMSNYLKKDSYKRISANYRAAQDVVTAMYAKSRKDIHQSYPAMTYNQYQQRMALEGSDEALKLLRKESVKSNFSGRGITGQGDNQITQIDRTIDKNGTIFYHYKGQVIKDNGKGLTSKDDSKMANLVLIEVATMKYGNTLTVIGDDDYLSSLQSIVKENSIDSKLVKRSLPLEEFVKKRNADRLRIKDIEEHRIYNGEHGQFIFGGYRNVDDTSAILLKRDGKVYVKQIHRKELKTYKQMKVGHTLRIAKNKSELDIER